MGTSRCSTWTTRTSGMEALAALEPPEQPAVPSAKTRETVTAHVVTFDIVFSPLMADSGSKVLPVRHRSMSVLLRLWLVVQGFADHSQLRYTVAPRGDPVDSPSTKISAP